jgi:hypothetical protein
MSEVIAAEANVLVPAHLALVGLGYEVNVERSGGRETWSATRGEVRLVADDTLALLGLHCLREERGPDWKASDAEIGEFLDRFGNGGPG